MFHRLIIVIEWCIGPESASTAPSPKVIKASRVKPVPIPRLNHILQWWISRTWGQQTFHWVTIQFFEGSPFRLEWRRSPHRIHHHQAHISLWHLIGEMPVVVFTDAHGWVDLIATVAFYFPVQLIHLALKTVNHIVVVLLRSLVTRNLVTQITTLVKTRHRIGPLPFNWYLAHNYSCWWWCTLIHRWWWISTNWG